MFSVMPTEASEASLSSQRVNIYSFSKSESESRFLILNVIAHSERVVPWNLFHLCVYRHASVNPYLSICSLISERGRERETSIGCLSHTLTGNQTHNLLAHGWCSNQLSHPARARHTSFYFASQILHFLEIEGVWQPCIAQLCQHYFSHSICSFCVSMSYFDDSHNI